MWDGFNKRKFPRLNLDCEIVIHPQGQERAIPVKTENVGLGGVCVILDEPLERFGRCEVKVSIPAKNHELVCRGKVVWTIPSKDIKTQKQFYDTGIEFENLPEESRQNLIDFIQESNR